MLDEREDSYTAFSVLIHNLKEAFVLGFWSVCDIVKKLITARASLPCWRCGNFCEQTKINFHQINIHVVSVYPMHLLIFIML